MVERQCLAAGRQELQWSLGLLACTPQADEQVGPHEAKSLKLSPTHPVNYPCVNPSLRTASKAGEDAYTVHCSDILEPG